MKTIRNIILVMIFGILISICLYIVPNYKKDGTEGKTNLVINYSNVTAKMKGEVIITDDGKIYISKEDIENYYDKYIYYDKKYDYIIATGNGKIAKFDLTKNTATINDKNINSSVIKKDDKYYIPISDIEDVYNIDVKYIKEYNIVLIESLDKRLESAKVKQKVYIKSESSNFSKKLEQLNENDKVYIVPKKQSDSSQNTQGNEKILQVIINKVKSLKSDNSGKWTLVRTSNGNLGYIKTDNLTETTVEREEIKEESKTISLVWDYYSEVGKAPQNTASTKYDGVNVVSPSFFYLEDGQLKENIGDEGVNYINWAKSNNYEVWPIVANNNNSEDKINTFSVLINDYKKREELINQIVEYVKEYKLDGINIDFENINKSDKDSLSRFIIELKPRLEALGAKLSVDVTEPDGSDRWSLCFDRNVIGDVADYIVFMAYDQYGNGSKKAGSTAAYYWVERNIKKFLDQEEVEANKIILGIPFYTRLWKDDGTKLTSTVIAIKNISKYIPSDVEVQWLEDSQQQYIEYEKNNVTYKMWIENEKSISQKLALIKKYKLAGAAYWQKGYENEEIWQIIKKQLME